MRIDQPANHTFTSSEILSLLLREAKRLHRLARSESAMKSLPILRRLIATKTLNNINLVDLNQQKPMIKRKHILHMLANEAGFAHWTAYRQAIHQAQPDQCKHFAFALGLGRYPNLWFATYREAQHYAAIHGGEVIKFGQQGLILARDSEVNSFGSQI